MNLIHNKNKCIFASTLSQCPSGNVTFQNQAQVDFFIVQYPNCTEIQGNLVLDSDANGPITNVSALQNLITIQGNFTIDYNIWMDNLEGLNSLEEVGGDIYINDCSLTDISALSNLQTIGGNLNMRKARFHNLTAFGNLLNLGGFFYYSNENLVGGVSNLNLNLTVINGDFTMIYAGSGSSGEITVGGNAAITTVNGDFYFRGPKVVSAEIFNNLTTVSGDFELESLGLQNLGMFSSLETVGSHFRLFGLYDTTTLDGFSSLSSIGESLTISSNYDLQSISGLAGVGGINGRLQINNNNSLTTLNGLDNISEINDELIIFSNDLLENISGIEHINPATITHLQIENNSSLSICDEYNICAYLDSGVNYSIANNAVGCNNYNEVIIECNLDDFNLISGLVSFDQLFNNCVSGATSVENIQIISTNGTNTYSTFTNSNGEYYLFVPEGTYNTSIVENIDYYESSPENYTHTFSGIGNQEIADFCIVPIPNINDLRVQIFPLGEARPGFDTRYLILYRNVGTTTISGSIDFTFDANRSVYLDADPGEDNLTVDTASWNFSDLAPFQQQNIIVNLNILPPPLNNQGDLLQLTAVVNPVDGDFMPEDNTFILNHEIINSMDPNDKMVIEGSEVLFEDLGDYLHYIIRFQNIGSASAINIEVEDILSSNLDLSTFELISLSHDGVLQLVENNMRVIFEDIQLPSVTTNEPESHGYITYRIKPKSNLEIGDSVENSADIYFDFNPAIITNTVVTTFVEEILSGSFNNSEETIVVYPNPTTGLLYIQTPTSLDIESISVLNVQGVKIKDVHRKSSLDLKDLLQGVYFLRIHTTSGNIIKRIIKK